MSRSLRRLKTGQVREDRMRTAKRMRAVIVAAVGVAIVLLAAPAAALAWDALYQDVDFVSAKVGWVVGMNSTIIRTTNGGHTWTTQKRVSGGPTLHDVCFYGKLHGWAVGDNARLYRTTNGGKRWVRVSATAFGTAALFSVKFMNASKGWVCGGQWSNTYWDTEQPWGYIWGTTDGGRTWSPQVTSTSACYTALDFVNGWTGVAVGRSRVQTGPSTGYDAPFLVSTTDGAFWTGYQQLGATTTTSMVYGLDFASGGRIVVVGEYGDVSSQPFLFSSGDWGTSWAEVNPATGPTDVIDVRMISNLVGYAVGRGSPNVYKTTDGGATWSLKGTSYGKELRGVDFVSTSTGYAVGATATFAHSPLIIKTINGARSWTRVK